MFYLAYFLLGITSYLSLTILYLFVTYKDRQQNGKASSILDLVNEIQDTNRGEWFKPLFIILAITAWPALLAIFFGLTFWEFVLKGLLEKPLPDGTKKKNKQKNGLELNDLLNEDFDPQVLEDGELEVTKAD